MTVRTCTKGMPASVLQHPAGQWWNFLRSTHNIHQSPAGVKRVFPKALQVILIFLYPGGFACSFFVPGITKAETAITWSQGQGMRAKPTPGQPSTFL